MGQMQVNSHRLLPPTIQGLIASACWEHDATLHNNGNPRWTNRIVTPADGANQSDYDFFKGVSESTSNDPTHDGTDFLFDGTQFMKSVKSTTAIPPTWANMHRADAAEIDWWMVLIGTLSGAADTMLVSSASSSAGNGLGLLWVTATNVITAREYNNNGLTNATNLATGTKDATFFLALSHDKTLNTITHWYNTGTGTSVARTLIDLVPGATPDASGALRLYSGAGGSNVAPAGSKLRFFAGGNGLLTNQNVQDLEALLQARHGVSYF